MPASLFSSSLYYRAACMIWQGPTLRRTMLSSWVLFLCTRRQPFADFPFYAGIKDSAPIFSPAYAQLSIVYFTGYFSLAAWFDFGFLTDQFSCSIMFSCPLISFVVFWGRIPKIRIPVFFCFSSSFPREVTQ